MTEEQKEMVDKPELQKKWWDKWFPPGPWRMVAGWGVAPPTLIFALSWLAFPSSEDRSANFFGFWFSNDPAVSPFFSLFGLFLFAVGLYLAGKRTQELLRQNDIAADQRTEFTEQNRIAAQGQVDERFSRAVEQLGHAAQAVRMGGLYGLEQIAREKEEYRRQIFEVLAGFVRARATIEYEENKKDEKSPPVAKRAKPRPQKIDVETAIKILARSAKEDERWVEDGEIFLIDLSGTDLRDLILTGQHLDRFDFRGARLSDENTGINLIKATLSGANLILATLTNARLEEAVLTGAYLAHATLTGAHLDSATLTGAELYEANLTDTDLMGVKGLTQEQLIDIRYEQGCCPKKLPPSLSVPDKPRNIIQPEHPDWVGWKKQGG